MFIHWNRKRKFSSEVCFFLLYASIVGTFHFYITQILKSSLNRNGYLGFGDWTTFLLSTRLFFSGEINRNLEGTGSIEKKNRICCFKTAQPFSFLFPQQSNRTWCIGNRSIVFRILLWESRNCYKESSEPFLHKKRISERKKEENENEEKRRDRIVLCATPKGIRIFARWRNKIEMQRGRKRFDSDARSTETSRNLETAEISTHPIQAADIFTRARVTGAHTFFFTIGRFPEFFMALAFTYRNIPRALGRIGPK